MSVTDNKMDQNAQTARDSHVIPLATAINQTSAIAFLRQFKTARKIEDVQVYARAVTATISCDVGLVQPGQVLDAGAITISTNKLGIKLTGPQRYVAPDGTYVDKATTDNIVSANNDTINNALTAGQWWGAWGVDLDNAGNVVFTRSAADQAFTTSALAVLAIPAVPRGYTRLGTLAVQTKAGAKVVLNTSDLSGGGAGGNDAAANTIANQASQLASVMTGTITPVAGDTVAGTLQAGLARVVGKKGALVVVSFTTDGTGALTNGFLTYMARPFPLDNEAMIP